MAAIWKTRQRRRNVRVRLSSEGIKERAVLAALSSPIRSVLAETARGNLESEKLTDERLRQSQTLLV